MRPFRFVAVALVCLTAACGGGDSGETKEEAASSTPAVTVKDFVFDPKSITVKAGTEVTWTNEDDFDHSVQIDDIDLKGPNFGKPSGNATFTHTFEDAGTFPYICGVHNSMTGTVVVTS